MTNQDNTNLFCKEISDYTLIPKSVLANILVSILSNQGELISKDLDELDKVDINLEIKKEWETLYNKGIIKNSPRVNLKNKAKQSKVN